MKSFLAEARGKQKQEAAVLNLVRSDSVTLLIQNFIQK